MFNREHAEEMLNYFRKSTMAYGSLHGWDETDGTFQLHDDDLTVIVQVGVDDVCYKFVDGVVEARDVFTTHSFTEAVRVLCSAILAGPSFHEEPAPQPSLFDGIFDEEDGPFLTDELLAEIGALAS